MHLKEIFHSETDSEDTQLSNYLISIEPGTPRLMHEIYPQTPAASRRTFIARTIQFTLSPDTDNKLPKDELADLERGVIIYWIKLYREAITLSAKSYVCPTILAQYLHQVSWKPFLKERMIEGVTIPNIIHQFVHTWSQSSLHVTCQGCSEYLEFCVKSVNDPHEQITTRGP